MEVPKKRDVAMRVPNSVNPGFEEIFLDFRCRQKGGHAIVQAGCNIEHFKSVY